mmetsp:Transcript_76981/g.124578  ORF Transcript_76981/g.124578 Transcript_76981/m.124578 type:complete len:257 (+) Transcript_76981:289-1059(+)
MRKSRDSRHLDGVTVLQRMIQDSRRVDDLPLHVVVVQVADKQRLCGESIGLHIHICLGHNVHEGGLAYVWVARQDQGPRRWIDRRQAPQVLPDLLEVGHGACQLLHRCAHATHGGALEHLALVQAIGKLHHLDVVFGNVVDNLLRRVDLTQGQLVVIPVVQHVAQIGIKRVDVIDLRKLLEHLGELLVESGLAELHLAHVEGTDPSDLEARVHNCWGLALGLGEYNVNKLLGRRNRLDLLELVHGVGLAHAAIGRY